VVVGLVLSIPLSYFFQSGLFRDVVPLSEYLQVLFDQQSRDEYPQIWNTAIWTAIICVAAGFSLVWP